MFKNTVFKRSIASFLLLVFSCLPSGPVKAEGPPAPGLQGIKDKNLPLNPEEWRIPKTLGKIDDSFKGEKGKVVVVIQDAHAIPAAQMNIRALLSFLQKKYGVDFVGMEGAVSRLDPQIFQSFPEKKILQETFQNYFEAGEATGGNVAAIFSKSPTLFHGLEDWKLYEEGLALYLASMKHENELKKKLQVWREDLLSRKQNAYSEKLLEVDAKWQAFQDKQADLPGVLKLCSGIKSPQEGSEVAAFLKESQENQAPGINEEREVKRLAEKVEKYFRSGSAAYARNEIQEFYKKKQAFQTSQISPHDFALSLKKLLEAKGVQVRLSGALGGQISNLQTVQQIEGTRFFKELEVYVNDVKQSLMRSPLERALDVESGQLELVEKLARLELSREEWEKFKMEILNPSIVTDSGSPIPSFFVKEDLRLPAAFYENAEKRDQTLFKNLLLGIKRLPSNRKSSREQLAVIVAGGFHAQGISSQLKEKNITHLLIMPAIDKLPNEIHYRDHMRGNVSWKKYFRVKNGKINVCEAFVRAARDKLLEKVTGSLGPQSPSKILKFWRDQIIRDLAAKGKVSEAGKYTKFIDELSGSQGRGSSEPESGALEKVEQFIEGLKRLKTENNLTEKNILNLLKPAAMVAEGFIASTLDETVNLSTPKELENLGENRAAILPLGNAAEKDMTTSFPEGAPAVPGLEESPESRRRSEMRSAAASAENFAGRMQDFPGQSERYLQMALTMTAQMQKILLKEQEGLGRDVSFQFPGKMLSKLSFQAEVTQAGFVYRLWDAEGDKALGPQIMIPFGSGLLPQIPIYMTSGPSQRYIPLAAIPPALSAAKSDMSGDYIFNLIPGVLSEIFEIYLAKNLLSRLIPESTAKGFYYLGIDDTSRNARERQAFAYPAFGGEEDQLSLLGPHRGKIADYFYADAGVLSMMGDSGGHTEAELIEKYVKTAEKLFQEKGIRPAGTVYLITTRINRRKGDPPGIARGNVAKALLEADIFSTAGEIVVLELEDNALQEFTGKNLAGQTKYVLRKMLEDQGLPGFIANIKQSLSETPASPESAGAKKPVTVKRSEMRAFKVVEPFGTSGFTRPEVLDAVGQSSLGPWAKRIADFVFEDPSASKEVLRKRLQLFNSVNSKDPVTDKWMDLMFQFLSDHPKIAESYFSGWGQLYYSRPWIQKYGEEAFFDFLSMYNGAENFSADGKELESLESSIQRFGLEKVIASWRQESEGKPFPFLIFRFLGFLEENGFIQTENELKAGIQLSLLIRGKLGNQGKEIQALEPLLQKFGLETIAHDWKTASNDEALPWQAVNFLSLLDQYGLIRGRDDLQMGMQLSAALARADRFLEERSFDSRLEVFEEFKYWVEKFGLPFFVEIAKGNLAEQSEYIDFQKPSLLLSLAGLKGMRESIQRREDLSAVLRNLIAPRAYLGEELVQREKTIVPPGGIEPKLREGKSTGQRELDDWLSERPQILAPLKINPEKYGAAQETLMSFKSYMETILHTDWGYYVSGRIKIGGERGDDFTTHPVRFSPYFGGAVAEHAFEMWREMIRSGVLKEDETFWLMEFGAGTGILMRDILHAIESRAGESPERLRFWNQVRGRIGERSPGLMRQQEAANKSFLNRGKLEIQNLDARTDIVQAYGGQKYKGLVYSNELLDAFGGHELHVSPAGETTATFVVPQLDSQILFLIPEAIKNTILSESEAIVRELGLPSSGNVYLSQKAFDMLMRFVWSDEVDPDTRMQWMRLLQFSLPEIPAGEIKELKDYLEVMQPVLEKLSKEKTQDVGVIANPAGADFLRGVSGILQAGYVLSIDYGATTDVIQQSYQQMGSLSWSMLRQRKMQKSFASYLFPGMLDVTFLVDFGYQILAGRKAGINTVFYGDEKTLMEFFNSTIPGGAGFKMPGPEGGQFKALVQQVGNWKSELNMPQSLPEKEGLRSEMRTSEGGLDGEFLHGGLILQNRISELTPAAGVDPNTWNAYRSSVDQIIQAYTRALEGKDLSDRELIVGFSAILYSVRNLLSLEPTRDMGEMLSPIGEAALQALQKKEATPEDILFGLKVVGYLGWDLWREVLSDVSWDARQGAWYEASSGKTDSSELLNLLQLYFTRLGSTETDARIRQAAGFALSQIPNGNPSETTALIQQAAARVLTGDNASRMQSFQVLSDSGPRAASAVKTLMEFLRISADEDLLREAMNALVQMNDAVLIAIPVLTGLAENAERTGEFRGAVVENLVRILVTLGNNDTWAVRQFLAEALNSESAEVRQEAFRGAGHLAARALPLLPQIVEALLDSDEYIGVAANEALTQIHEDHSAEVLDAIRQAAHSHAGDDHERYFEDLIAMYSRSEMRTERNIREDLPILEGILGRPAISAAMNFPFSLEDMNPEQRMTYFSLWREAVLKTTPADVIQGAELLENFIRPHYEAMDARESDNYESAAKGVLLQFFKEIKKHAENPKNESGMAKAAVLMARLRKFLGNLPDEFFHKFNEIYSSERKSLTGLWDYEKMVKAMDAAKAALGAAEYDKAEAQIQTLESLQSPMTSERQRQFLDLEKELEKGRQIQPVFKRLIDLFLAAAPDSELRPLIEKAAALVNKGDAHHPTYLFLANWVNVRKTLNTRLLIAERNVSGGDYKNGLTVIQTEVLPFLEEKELQARNVKVPPEVFSRERARYEALKEKTRLFTEYENFLDEAAKALSDDDENKVKELFDQFSSRSPLTAGQRERFQQVSGQAQLNKKLQQVEVLLDEGSMQAAERALTDLSQLPQSRTQGQKLELLQRRLQIKKRIEESLSRAENDLRSDAPDPGRIRESMNQIMYAQNEMTAGQKEKASFVLSLTSALERMDQVAALFTETSEDEYERTLPLLERRLERIGKDMEALPAQELTVQKAQARMARIAEFVEVRKKILLSVGQNGEGITRSRQGQDGDLSANYPRLRRVETLTQSLKYPEVEKIRKNLLEIITIQMQLDQIASTLEQGLFETVSNSLSYLSRAKESALSSQRKLIDQLAQEYEALVLWSPLQKGFQSGQYDETRRLLPAVARAVSLIQDETIRHRYEEMLIGVESELRVRALAETAINEAQVLISEGKLQEAQAKLEAVEQEKDAYRLMDYDQQQIFLNLFDRIEESQKINGFLQTAENWLRPESLSPAKSIEALEAVEILGLERMNEVQKEAYERITGRLKKDHTADKKVIYKFFVIERLKEVIGRALNFRMTPRDKEIENFPLLENLPSLDRGYFQFILQNLYSYSSSALHENYFDASSLMSHGSSWSFQVLHENGYHVSFYTAPNGRSSGVGFDLVPNIGPAKMFTLPSLEGRDSYAYEVSNQVKDNSTSFLGRSVDRLGFANREHAPVVVRDHWVDGKLIYGLASTQSDLASLPAGEWGKIPYSSRLEWFGFSDADIGSKKEVLDIFYRDVGLHEQRHRKNQVFFKELIGSGRLDLSKATPSIEEKLKPLLGVHYQKANPKDLHEAVLEEISAYLTQLGLGKIPAVLLGRTLPMAENLLTSPRGNKEFSPHAFAAADIFINLYRFLRERNFAGFKAATDEEIFNEISGDFEGAAERLTRLFYEGALTRRDLIDFADQTYKKKFAGRSVFDQPEIFPPRTNPERTRLSILSKLLGQALRGAAENRKGSSAWEATRKNVLRLKTEYEKIPVDYAAVSPQSIQAGNILRVDGKRFLVAGTPRIGGRIPVLPLDLSEEDYRPDVLLLSAGHRYEKAIVRSEMRTGWQESGIQMAGLLLGFPENGLDRYLYAEGKEGLEKRAASLWMEIMAKYSGYARFFHERMKEEGEARQEWEQRLRSLENALETVYFKFQEPTPEGRALLDSKLLKTMGSYNTFSDLIKSVRARVENGEPAFAGSFEPEITNAIYERAGLKRTDLLIQLGSVEGWAAVAAAVKAKMQDRSFQEVPGYFSLFLAIEADLNPYRPVGAKPFRVREVQKEIRESRANLERQRIIQSLAGLLDSVSFLGENIQIRNFLAAIFSGQVPANIPDDAVMAQRRARFMAPEEASSSELVQEFQQLLPSVAGGSFSPGIASSLMQFIDEADDHGGVLGLESLEAAKEWVALLNLREALIRYTAPSDGRRQIALQIKRYIEFLLQNTSSENEVRNVFLLASLIFNTRGQFQTALTRNLSPLLNTNGHPIQYYGPRFHFSKDKKTFAAFTRNRLAGFSGETFQPIAEMEELTGDISRFVYSRDGRTFAVGLENGRVSIFDSKTFSVLGHGVIIPGMGGEQPAAISELVYSPDGQTLAAVSRDGGIAFLDTVSGNVVAVQDPQIPAARISYGRPVVSVLHFTFSPQADKGAAAFNNKRIRIYDARSGNLISETPEMEDVSRIFEFSSDGKILAAGLQNGKVVFFDAASGKRIENELDLGKDITTLKPLDNGQMIIGSHGVIRLYDPVRKDWVGEGIVLGEGKDHLGKSLISPDQSRLVAGSYSGSVWVMDLVSGQTMQKTEGIGRNVVSFAFSSDGRILAAGTESGGLAFFDPASGTLLGEKITGFFSGVYSLSFSPDGKILAAGGRDDLWILDASRRAIISSIHINSRGGVVNNAGFSEDGATFIAAGEFAQKFDVPFRNFPNTETLSATPSLRSEMRAEKPGTKFLRFKERMALSPESKQRLEELKADALISELRERILSAYQKDLFNPLQEDAVMTAVKNLLGFEGGLLDQWTLNGKLEIYAGQLSPEISMVRGAENIPIEDLRPLEIWQLLLDEALKEAEISLSFLSEAELRRQIENNLEAMTKEVRLASPVTIDQIRNHLKEKYPDRSALVKLGLFRINPKNFKIEASNIFKAWGQTELAEIQTDLRSVLQKEAALNNRLKKARQYLGDSQDKLAQRAGMKDITNQGMISEYETGKIFPSEIYVKTLAGVLDIDAGMIWWGKEFIQALKDEPSMHVRFRMARQFSGYEQLAFENIPEIKTPQTNISAYENKDLTEWSPEFLKYGTRLAKFLNIDPGLLFWGKEFKEVLLAEPELHKRLALARQYLGDDQKSLGERPEINLDKSTLSRYENDNPSQRSQPSEAFIKALAGLLKIDAGLLLWRKEVDAALMDEPSWHKRIQMAREYAGESVASLARREGIPVGSGSIRLYERNKTPSAAYVTALAGISGIRPELLQRELPESLVRSEMRTTSESLSRKAQDFAAAPDLVHYRALDETDKEQLTKLLRREELAIDSNEDTEIWYPGVVQGALEINRFLEAYPDAQVISLGSSPEWLIRTFELMENLYRPENEPRRKYYYPAFSGFSGSIVSSERMVNPSDAAVYRRYLSQMNLTPQSIAERKGPTFVFEFPGRGSSAVAFMRDIWEDWAAEEGISDQLREKWGVRYLHYVDFLNPGEDFLAEAVASTVMPSLRMSPLSREKASVQIVSRDLMGSLVNSESHLDNRMTPYWDSFDWQEGPPSQEVSLRAALTQFQIIQYLEIQQEVFAPNFSRSEMRSAAVPEIAKTAFEEIQRQGNISQATAKQIVILDPDSVIHALEMLREQVQKPAASGNQEEILRNQKAFLRMDQMLRLIKVLASAESGKPAVGIVIPEFSSADKLSEESLAKLHGDILKKLPDLFSDLVAVGRARPGFQKMLNTTLGEDRVRFVGTKLPGRSVPLYLGEKQKVLGVVGALDDLAASQEVLNIRADTGPGDLTTYDFNEQIVALMGQYLAAIFAGHNLSEQDIAELQTLQSKEMPEEERKIYFKKFSEKLFKAEKLKALLKGEELGEDVVKLLDSFKQTFQLEGGGIRFLMAKVQEFITSASAELAAQRSA